MSEIGRMALVAFGIGLVIFVHELGHFLAARLCKVRVEVFSLGFGPRLLGWRRGATLYQLALLPLGGYVRMAGEEREDGRAPASDELPAKSVGARFFIYSGGVLMNLLFALAVFPILLATGVPMLQPIVGSTLPGGPAWRAGVPAGARVLAVNGHEVLGFLHIPPEVALGPSEQTTLTILDPGSRTPRTLALKPEYSEGLGIYTIGVNPPTDPAGTIEVEDDSPAARAGLQSGDRLLAVAGAPAGLSLEESLLFGARDGGPLELRYLRLATDDEGRELSRAEGTARVELEPATGRAPSILGVAPLANRVHELRPGERTRRLGLQKDDRILSVNGLAILRPFDLLLGLRRPAEALVFEVARAGERLRLEGPAPSSAEALEIFRDVALGNDVDSARVVPQPRGAAAEAGVRDGDRIVALAGRPVSRFEDLHTLLDDAGRGRALDLVVRRLEDGGEHEHSFSVRPRSAALTHGIGLQLDNYVYKASGPAEAVRVGFASSWKFLQESWLMLRRILTGQVSGDNVGGIITIGVVSHSWAAMGLAKLFFFLCMLSINLAFLNVLPIPVLDGGHLFFLLIEKIKGSPVSERVLSYSQIVGIVLIVSLMVYVTFNDIQRWILN